MVMETKSPGLREQTELSDYLNCLLLDSTLSVADDVIEQDDNEVIVKSSSQTVSTALDYKDDGRYFFAQIGSARVAFPLLQLRHLIHLKARNLHNFHKQEKFLLGHIRYQNDHVPVYHLGGLLERLPMISPEKIPDYALLLEDWSLAITVDGVEKIEHVGREEITWRRPSPNNPWHAGIIRQTMTSILDLNMVGKVLHSLKMRQTVLGDYPLDVRTVKG